MSVVTDLLSKGVLVVIWYLVLVVVVFFPIRIVASKEHYLENLGTVKRVGMATILVLYDLAEIFIQHWEIAITFLKLLRRFSERKGIHILKVRGYNFSVLRVGSPIGGIDLSGIV